MNFYCSITALFLIAKNLYLFIINCNIPNCKSTIFYSIYTIAGSFFSKGNPVGRKFVSLYSQRGNGGCTRHAGVRAAILPETHLKHQQPCISTNCRS